MASGTGVENGRHDDGVLSVWGKNDVLELHPFTPAQGHRTTNVVKKSLILEIRGINDGNREYCYLLLAISCSRRSGSRCALCRAGRRVG